MLRMISELLLNKINEKVIIVMMISTITVIIMLYCYRNSDSEKTELNSCEEIYKNMRDNALVIYGPPGIGKSTVIKLLKEKLAIHALDLEDQWPTAPRKVVQEALVFGAAGLRPLQAPSKCRKLLLVMGQERYKERREKRDLAIPSKQYQANHLMVDWVNKRGWDYVIRTDELSAHKTAKIISNIVREKWEEKTLERIGEKEFVDNMEQERKDTMTTSQEEDKETNFPASGKAEEHAREEETKEIEKNKLSNETSEKEKELKSQEMGETQVGRDERTNAKQLTKGKRES
jgi:hypothetical protein